VRRWRSKVLQQTLLHGMKGRHRRGSHHAGAARNLDEI
jgi:hypothetical protein